MAENGYFSIFERLVLLLSFPTYQVARGESKATHQPTTFLQA